MSQIGDDLRALSKGVAFSDWPVLPCPTCGARALRLGDEPKVTESAASLKSHDHDAWEPEWITGRFGAVLQCGGCDEQVIAIGDARVTEKYEGKHWYGDYEAWLVPTMFRPALPLFVLPAQCPTSVRELLAKSSEVLLTDPSLAVNRMRSAEEALLTAHRVRRFRVVKSKRHTQTLHERLEEFGVRRPDVSELLMAVKWLGNDASHTDVLTFEDAVGAAEILELAIELLYDSRTELRRLASAIVKNKGVARRR